MRKIIIALFVILYCGLLNTFAYAADDVSVYVNGAPVLFGENKPLIKNSRTLAPARDVFGSVGAEIEWDAHYKKVSVSLYGRKMELRIGSKQAVYSTTEGSKTINTDVAPEIINGATYVPLSVIADALGGEVVWDKDDRAAYFTFGSGAEEQTEMVEEFLDDQLQEHAVPTNQTFFEAPAIPLVLKLSGFNVSIGDTTEDAQSKLGKHTAQNVSVYGYAWQEINYGKDNFLLLGADSGSIVALYTNAKKVSIAGVTPGMSALQLNAAVGVSLPEERKSVIETDEGRLTIYRNSIDNYSVLAVMAQKTGHTTAVKKFKNDFYSESTERLLAGFINTGRLNNGVTALKKDESLSEIARAHSIEMAQGNYLSSEDKSGKSAFDRMNDSAFDGYEMASENIGRDAYDAIEMYFEWMNDRSYAANILDEHYNYFGVGVAPCPNEHKMYFTVDFIEIGR